MHGLELQIVQALLGILSVGVTAGLAYLAPKLKALFHSMVANKIMAALQPIIEGVVQEFNQKVVSDAKKNDVFNAQMAQTVKQDAIAAVTSQGSAIIKLGELFLGNMQSLVSSQIEKAVVQYKV